MSKRNQLTFTRFVAAIAILIFHADRNISIYKSPLLSGLFINSAAGVSYFFILSGFVMIVAYKKEGVKSISPGNFYINRIARVYPIYIIALLVMIFFNTIKHLVSVPGITLSAFMLQAWFPGYVELYNSPGWSLSIEAFFYAIFPFLFNWFYTRKSWKTLALIVLPIWVFSQLTYLWLYHSSFYKGYPSPSHDFLFYFPLMHLSEFLIGNLAGLASLRVSFAKRNYDLVVVVIGIAIILLLMLPLQDVFHNGLLAVLFVPFILCLALTNGPLNKLLSNKVLVFLGEISFGIYILQLPVLRITDPLCRLAHINNADAKFAVHVFTLIAASALCYQFIEIPARARIRRSVSRPNPVAVL